MQELVGINQPIAGAILGTRTRRSGAVLCSSEFVRLGIEAEIAVRIGKEFTETEALTPAEVLERIEYICAAFEVIEDREADYKTLDAASLIADNSWNKGIILGAPVSAAQVKTLIGRRGVLTLNGALNDEGMSEDVGGDPLQVVGWLGAHLAKRGRPLQPGQWVMTGSIITTKFPNSGDKFHFVVEGLEPVEVRIT